ncbi:hypothetical protein [Haloplanus aerogenes]|uniref:Uncharacterized protein n=1 Tax=Haloplanus aerogenes TaxID=660522 RepID=A0A3M0CX50_9EURY|nr:hypothetical protein [Haloplanus aerogenes]AZH27040.1 hypothetical protein DU502_17385 [Haloplanus aerogenes]RMB13467.1 hypothetical protein ATH50_2804 [Haloplanus aerogenes]
MQRRVYLRRVGALTLGTAVAGCSESGSAASTPDESGTNTAPPSETATTTATATATAEPTPTPGPRSLAPYRSWLVAPTPVTPYTYEFTHLSLSAVREDATRSFAESLNTYWRQRSTAYFGFDVPVESLDAVLTVNHSRVANESYRVASGSFDPAALRGPLVDAGFTADGWVDDVQRFTRTENGQLRAVGLHPDLLVSIGTDASATAPLETAVEQHTGGDVRTEDDEALALLIDHYGTADYVTGRELEPAAEDYPLSKAVATGRRLDVRGATTWTERTYVLPPDATIDEEAVREEIRTRHVGQPIKEFRRDGRLLTAAGEVENSLIRLI